MLLRIIRPNSDKRVYYFAFGANLSPKILRLRRICVYETFDYVLEDAVLNFSQRGFYKNHGFASADASMGDRVYGKMYLIRQSDAKRMDYFEGVPFLKAHAKIVQQAQGKPFYFYRSRAPLNDLKPTQQYLDYLTSAYSNMSIVPRQYTDALLATKVLKTLEPSDQTGVFVRHLSHWPKAFHPLLKHYEKHCHRLVEALWNRSLLGWMIRV
jgi:gamma-glutamylcyclotransferase (GGCT)/AIG2-like uncharacterized protein YtfP|tara:strand:+ start:223 stop:855 length:633 start_codon:yes stop_codon:yes gene_type:complete